MAVLANRLDDGEPGPCLIAYLLELAPYLADARLLALAQAVFGGHVRIAQTEIKIQAPYNDDIGWRGYHSDWPHDLSDKDKAGRVAQPFPDVTMQLSVLWMISEFSPANGGTWVVPEPRVAVITRYAPWWLSLEFGSRNSAFVSADIYDALPDGVKVLYRHRAAGQENPFRA